MPIDEFIPHFIASEYHALEVSAPVQRVYSSLLSIDFKDSQIIRTLFRLRGIPGRGLTLHDLQNAGFIHLGEVADREYVLGLVGRFWNYRAEPVLVNPLDFRAFKEKGYAKAVISFSFHRLGRTTTRAETETRVVCTDEASRRRFRIYWFFVAPFSGLIRKEMLRLIKAAAEIR